MVQMRKGLCEALQLESFVQKYPKEMHCFLVASKSFDITSNYQLDSMLIRYSDDGGNNCTLEEAVIIYWTEYVTECPGVCV